MLALPEDEPARALVRFAELDGARPLLGRGWLRFDMRDPAKLVARKPGLNQNHALAEPATIDGASAPAAIDDGAVPANAGDAADPVQTKGDTGAIGG